MIQAATHNHKPRVRIVTSDGENDDYIAILAQTLGAVAVLAQDSDFYAYDLKFSLYVPFSSLKMGDCEMSGRGFNGSDIATHMGLTMIQWHTFCYLLGNDEILDTELESVHGRIRKFIQTGGNIQGHKKKNGKRSRGGWVNYINHAD